MQLILNEVRQHLRSEVCKCYTQEDVDRDVATLSIALNLRPDGALQPPRNPIRAAHRLAVLRLLDGDVIKCIQSELAKSFDPKDVPPDWFIRLFLPLDESEALSWIPFEWQKTRPFADSDELRQYIQSKKGRLDVNEMMARFGP